MKTVTPLLLHSVFGFSVLVLCERKEEEEDEKKMERKRNGRELRGRGV